MMRQKEAINHRGLERRREKTREAGERVHQAVRFIEVAASSRLLCRTGTYGGSRNDRSSRVLLCAQCSVRSRSAAAMTGAWVEWQIVAAKATDGYRKSIVLQR